MFAVATKAFVQEVDDRGLLVPVSSLNDSISILTVVVKRKRFWFWQKPKYLPTDFILNDLLAGDTPLTPTVTKMDFIKYSGTFGDNIQGSVDASFVKASVTVEGKDNSQLKSSFGSLIKEEIDVPKLLEDSKDRVLDMSHSLIQQAKEKHKQVFGIVKERIVTTQPCSVIEEVQQDGQCTGGLNSCGPVARKVSLKENANLSKDSNITMEIPTNTTLAYSLIELEVKQNGHFELCLTSNTHGGFEVDGPAGTRLQSVSGAPVNTSEQICLQAELKALEDHFLLLSALPASTRGSLLQPITDLMEDPAAIRALQTVLRQMCLKEEPGQADPQKQNIQAVLDVLDSAKLQPTQSSSVLSALHLLISALDEIPHDCLALLRKCRDPTSLQMLELMVQCVAGKEQITLSSTAPTERIYKRTEHLLACANVSLKRDGDVVRTEIDQKPGHLPLILCIAVKALVSLAKGC